MLRLTDDTNIGAGAVTAVSRDVVCASTPAPRRKSRAGRDGARRWPEGCATTMGGGAGQRGGGDGRYTRCLGLGGAAGRMEEAQGGTLYAPVGDELRDGPPGTGDGLAATLGQVVKQRAAAQQVLRSQRSSIGPMQL